MLRLQVPVERLRFELEQSLVNVVHYTGVDINKAARDPYYAESLPYVPGLGQRKARSLLDKLKQAVSVPRVYVVKIFKLNANDALQGGTLLNRADMLNKGMITAKVFWNATAFIRIDQGFLKSASLDEVDSEDHPDILDATRIHNEDYEIARKMASDAVELDDEDIQNLDHPSESVKMLLQDDVKKLDELRLDDFAEELAKIMDQPKRLTLYRIREELQRPFFDARPAMPMPTPLEQFQQITGETVETLRTGKIVPVVVLRVQKDRSVLVRFDSGVLGKIEAGYIFDASQVDGQGEVVTAPENLLQNNDTVRAAILGGIDQPRDTLNGIMGKDFLFQLDCRPQQVASRGEQEQSFERRQLSLDEFYDIEAAQQYETAQETKNQKKSGRQRRLIQHDNFHNFNAGQAEEYLSSQSRGDCVIRPSGKGVHNLTCTWKVADGIYQHFDILELEKPGGNDLALGRRLQVGLGNSRVTYHDLDELIYSHVRATADRVEEMIRHEKFKGTKEDTVSFCRNFQMVSVWL